MLVVLAKLHQNTLTIWEIQKINYITNKFNKLKTHQNSYQNKINKEFYCKRCKSKHGPKSCPVYGKKCTICNRLGHINQKYLINNKKISNLVKNTKFYELKKYIKKKEDIKFNIEKQINKMKGFNIFTDDSNQDNNQGIGIFSKKNNISLSYRLENRTSCNMHCIRGGK